MDANQLTEKLTGLLGAGKLEQNTAEGRVVWILEDDGLEVFLGATLEEAWENLDKFEDDLGQD